MVNDIQGPPNITPAVPELLMPHCVKTPQDVQELVAFMEEVLNLAKESWKKEHGIP